MITIRYSNGSDELKEAVVENNGGASTKAQAEQMFNQVKPIDDSFVGFRTNSVGSASSRPRLSYNHPLWQQASTGGWDLHNGITVTFKEDAGGFYGGSISLLLNGNSANWEQKYYDSDGIAHTTISHTPQAATITIIPTGVSTNIRRFTLEFWAMNRDKIQIINIIAGGELIIFDKLLSSNLIEQMNILSDDLAVNEFDFSVLSEHELYTNNKFCVYSNNEYYGMFWTDNVDKISQNYDATKKVYTVEAVNSIGLLDKCSFDKCTYIFMNGACAGEAVLTREISNQAKIDVEIQKDTQTPYGILGFVPVNTLRYFLCEFGWATSRWVCSARRDNIYLKKIPTSVPSNRIITSDYIIGNSTFKKSKPITSAIWTHPTTDIAWGTTGTAFTLSLPAGTNKKYYYDNPPSYIDLNRSEFSFAEIYANYFVYTANSSVSSVSGYNTRNIKRTETIKGLDAAVENVVDYSRFECVGMTNYVPVSAAQLGFSVYNDFYFYLYKLSSFNPQTYAGTPIDDSDLLVTQKRNDIQKYIKSTGTVTATVILKDNLKSLQVGDMVSIDTAFEGRITGIVTKMDISFGYNNTAKVEIRESSAFLA